MVGKCTDENWENHNLSIDTFAVCLLCKGYVSNNNKLSEAIKKDNKARSKLYGKD